MYEVKEGSLSSWRSWVVAVDVHQVLLKIPQILAGALATRYQPSTLLMLKMKEELGQGWEGEEEEEEVKGWDREEISAVLESALRAVNC